MLLNQTPGDQVSRLIVAVLHPQPLRDAVFQFVGVGERGVRVETDQFGKIVNAGYVVVVKVRFDRVLVPFIRFAAAERIAEMSEDENRR